eukprot:gnl/TRDRNA2_/TRDRNA2_187897_c0_seq1.p1 gnl/TRDRNA2_/TRDRNA2_187897_c0~~gnl/TRDRNA2_/TRDRNA2_187897_c0_seq1.p1  ORF type:complete len:337 (-),score=57.86 gnl/TRDRNA2_/TRDRNA2_187897_c0_seq1:75-1085(-)
MVEEAPDKHTELRAKLLTESLENSNKPGWGYFGLCGPLAIGDNYAPRMQKKPKTDDDAEPKWNIKTAPCKKGMGPDVYFRFEPPLALGDPYQDPQFMVKLGKVQYYDPEACFKPPGAIKYSTNKLGYEYEPASGPVKDPKEIYAKYKEYVPPRNILTQPTKRGGGGTLGPGVLFGFGEQRLPVPEHMPDDYDAAKKDRYAELMKDKAKEQEAPFRPADYGNRLFHGPGDVMHYDQPTHVPREPVPFDFHAYPHEQKFKPSNPSKRGALYGCMNPFPEHIPDPIHQAVRRKPADGEEEKQSMRIGAPNKPCNPMPSITTMPRNMRAERPSSFMRPSL